MNRQARMVPLVAGSVLLAALAGCSQSVSSGAIPTPDATLSVAAPSATSASTIGSLPPVPFASGNRARGEQLFSSAGCSGCHAVNGMGGQVGPDLTEVAKRAPSRAATQGLDRPELYFVQSVVYPTVYVVEGFSPVMPDWKQMQLSEQDLADLVAFLRTLTGE